MADKSQKHLGENKREFATYQKKKSMLRLHQYGNAKKKSQAAGPTKSFWKEERHQSDRTRT